VADTLTRRVRSVVRSRRNTSRRSFVSFGTSVVASEAKATNRPLPLMAGVMLSKSPWVPSVATLAMTVVPALRSRTNTSNWSFVSPSTRLVAKDAKATLDPSALIDG
jgi:hypothetical protein